MGRSFIPVALASLLVAACSGSNNDYLTGSSDMDRVQGWLNETGEPVQSTTNSVRNAAPVSQMIDGLARRLESQPNDEAGWRLLAQSYAYIGDMEKARVAADRAVALGADSQAISAALVQAHTDRRR